MSFIFYISLILFAVLNVITGVFCQTAIESTKNNDEEVIHEQLKYKSRLAHKLREIFEVVDSDKSGTISLQELEEYCEDPKVIAFFNSLEIDTTDVWYLFHILDEDESGHLHLDEFVMGLQGLKGAAKRIDMQFLLGELRRALHLATTYIIQEVQHQGEM